MAPLCAPADENKRVSRLCEVQDGSSSVSVSGLSLGPSSLNPLLRALKLQSSLTELRISGNRLHDLLPELVATVITMPRLRLLDVSACHITGDGLERAVNALKGQRHPTFPVRRPVRERVFVPPAVIIVSSVISIRAVVKED